MTAAVGSNPEWLTTNDGSALWNLDWTVDGLRGMTGETHVGARIRLDAGADPPVERVGGTAPIGVFWASSDDRTTITAAEWFAHQVTLTTADGSTADVPGRQRPTAGRLVRQRHRRHRRELGWRDTSVRHCHRWLDLAPSTLAVVDRRV